MDVLIGLLDRVVTSADVVYPSVRTSLFGAFAGAAGFLFTLAQFSLARVKDGYDAKVYRDIYHRRMMGILRQSKGAGPWEGRYAPLNELLELLLAGATVCLVAALAQVSFGLVGGSGLSVEWGGWRVNVAGAGSATALVFGWAAMCLVIRGAVVVRRKVVGALQREDEEERRRLEPQVRQALGLDPKVADGDSPWDEA